MDTETSQYSYQKKCLLWAIEHWQCSMTLALGYPHLWSW